MAEAGATVERLREATGVIASEWEDTIPFATPLDDEGEFEEIDTIVETPTTERF